MANKKQTIAACFSNSAGRKLITGHLSGLGHTIVEFQEKAGIQADLFILDMPSAGRIGTQVLSLKKAENIFLPMMVVLGKNDALDPWLAPKSSLARSGPVMSRPKAWSNAEIPHGQARESGKGSGSLRGKVDQQSGAGA